MVRQVQVVVSDRIRMPKGTIPLKDLKDRYLIELYNDTACGKCSNRLDRDPTNELCSECPAFQGVHRFYNSKEYQEGVISLPQADILGIKSYLRRRDKPFEIIDQRKVHRVRQPFYFNGKLFKKGDKDSEGNPRADQRTAAKQWLKKKTGVIVAPARSGKTVLATYLYAKAQVRTVIVADKRELLNQFYETAVGVPAPRFVHNKMVPSDKKAGRTAMTNLAEVMEDSGKPSIFMPSSFSNLLAFIKKFGVPDVLLITYQSFIRDLSRVAKILNKYYSMVVVDEEHGTGADSYLRFIASLNMKYRLGLTATPDRKDARSRLAARVFGPVVAVVETVTLKPTIEFYAVNAKPKTKYASWYAASKWQKTSKDRNIEIVRMVFKDLRDGHNVIIIPVEHKDHMEQLVKMINAQAKTNFKKKNENWPADLARPFHSGIKDRLEVLNWVDSTNDKSKIHKKLPTRSPRVLVAIRGMIKQGVDMKRPSMLYSILPMSAKHIVGAPMFYQMSFRPCTPYAGKPTPIVRVFVDNIKMFAGCASTLLFNEILPNSTLKDREKGRYILADYESAKRLVASRTRDQATQVTKWW